MAPRSTSKRPRAHELALAVAQPSEDAVLAAVAKHWRGGCKPHELPSELLADVRGALQRELRALLEELAYLRDPNTFASPRPRLPPPIADLLEPELRPESTNLQPVTPRAPGPPPLPAGVSPSSRPTAPPPPDWEQPDEDLTPIDEDDPALLYPLEFDPDADTSPGFKRPGGGKRVPLSRRPTRPISKPIENATGRTHRSMPPPPPDVLAARLRDPNRKS